MIFHLLFVLFNVAYFTRHLQFVVQIILLAQSNFFLIMFSSQTLRYYVMALTLHMTQNEMI